MDDAARRERQQRASEYFLENERLTRNLTDDQARPLIEWASQQAAWMAADPARSDADVEQVLQAIRRAVLTVAHTAAHEHDRARLEELARAALAQQMPPYEQ
jgi:L-lactate utilization protein LutC